MGFASEAGIGRSPNGLPGPEQEGQGLIALARAHLNGDWIVFHMGSDDTKYGRLLV